MSHVSAVQKIQFYEDELSTWEEADGMICVSLWDLCAAFGLEAKQQTQRLTQDPLFEGHYQWGVKSLLMGKGASRSFEDVGVDLEMLPMWLARLSANRINEVGRPKVLRYQRESAKVLRAYWQNRRLIDVFVLPEPRKWGQEYDWDFANDILRLYGLPPAQPGDPYPACVGGFIGRYIRSVLPAPVRGELRRVNPRSKRGNRSTKDHQHLTEEARDRVERERHRLVAGYAKGAENIRDFERMLQAYDRRTHAICEDVQRFGTMSIQGALALEWEDAHE